ncbi:MULTISPECIES: type II toxin-antitoxin system VapC family toxin [Gordonia]|uniref:type II toxin-antitoxin system VapC family toxin n=1 Tax=Gordonia TaxID=2053 RepID=UPI003394CA15
MTRASAPPIVYVDTNVYCDLIGRNGEKHKDTGEKRWKIAKAIFDAVNADRIVLAASALVQAEVMCLGDYRNGDQSVHDLVRGWFTARSTLWTDVDRFLADDAARLARVWHPHRFDPEKKLGGADATHLAAAVRLGCSFLLTHDEGFPLGMEVEGVNVMRPRIVWEVTLEDELAELETEAADTSRARKPPE